MRVERSVRGPASETRHNNGPEQLQQGGERKLLNHLVGDGEQRRRHREPKRLGGLKIDHQLVLGRGLHGKIGRLLSLENAVDIAGRTTILIGSIRPVRQKAAACDLEAVGVDCWQLVSGSELYDEITINPG